MATFNVETDSILHGTMRGAHGQEGGLRWAWIHEECNGVEQDIVLMHDAPRSIIYSILCGDFEIESEADVRHVLEKSYFSPPWDGSQSIPTYPTGWDSRAFLL